MGTHFVADPVAGMHEIDDDTGQEIVPTIPVHALPGGMVTVHQSAYKDARFQGQRIGLFADLCDKVYDINQDEKILGDPSWTAPPGWRVDDMFHRKAIGALAALYTNGPDWVLCFRGSDLPHGCNWNAWDELKYDLSTDWFGDDFPQGLGVTTPQYRWAIETARDLLETHVADPTRKTLSFTGHSLGGGLAAVASMFSGVVPTVTFNAAAVHENTKQVANAARSRAYSEANITIDCRPNTERDRILGYRVDGEVVSVLENFGHSMIRGVPTHTGKLIVMAPAPEDASKLLGLRVPQSLMRHMMGVVKNSLRLPAPNGLR